MYIRINNSSNMSSRWKAISQFYIKRAGQWDRIRQGYIRVNNSSTMSSRWKRFYYEANLPTQTTAPTIRTTNNSGTGTIYDGPVATSPRYLNDDLFGKDGSYSNYTSIYGRKFSRASTSDATSRTTIVNDDRFTSAGGVTTAMRTACDEQFLFYELTVSNGGDDQIYPVSSPIKMIKNFPNLIDCGWTDVEQVGTQLNFNYSIENYYYNSIEPGSSYIRWWRSTNTNPGGTLLKEETITATTTGTPSSTSRSGTSSYTPTSSDLGYYIVAQIIAVSSYTRHNGYTDNYSLASFPTGGVITGPLEFSSIAVKDYYGNKGLDNRDRWPTGTLNQYTGTVSGWNSGTVLRIRYRIYNFDTGLYWKPSTGTQTTASAAWDSWNSDGSGNGYISNVSVSGGTATFYDYFSLDQTKFNGGGSGPTWWLEIELSALRNGTRIFYNSSNLIPETYYISKRIDPTVSVSPSTVGLNTNVTISGTFAGFPATPSTNAYPRQYIVYYGDGNDSGYLPVGEWANGTLNPTYSLTKSYTTAGTYTVTVRAVPYGTDATTTVTAAAVKTAPTITSVTSGAKDGPVTVYFSGGSGPYYQMYWTTGVAPTTPVTPDASGSSSPLTDSTGPASAGTNWYMYVRSVASLGETSVGPSTVASAWSAGYNFTVTESPPTNLTLPTLSPTSISIGTQLSAGIGTWNNNPTGYDIRIYRGTANVATSETLVASRTGSSTANLTYNVTQADYDSGQRYFRTFVDASNSGGSSGLVAGQERGPISAPVSQYSVTWNANGGTGGTTTGPFDAGTAHTAPSVSRSGYTFNGWYTASSGGSYIAGAGGSYTPTSTTTVYAQWTVAFTPPSSGAPSWSSGSNFSRKTTSPTHLQWFTDYPSISGDGSFTGMQFEIRTTAGGGTLLASGTRSYPGAGSYPYSAAGTIWAFRMGTTDGDISYSSSARYGRVRTVMLGTNGTTYYGTWSGWI